MWPPKNCLEPEQLSTKQIDDGFRAYQRLYNDQRDIHHQAKGPEFASIFKHCANLDEVNITMQHSLCRTTTEFSKRWRKGMIYPFGDGVGSYGSIQALSLALIGAASVSRTLRVLRVEPLASGGMQ